MAEPNDSSEDLIESLLASGFGDEPEPEPPSSDVVDRLFPKDTPGEAPPVPPSRPAASSDPMAKKKPKIDLAALKRAKESKSSQASVSRLFGEPEPQANLSPLESFVAEEPEPPKASVEPPAPSIVKIERAVRNRRRSIAEFIDEQTETIQATHPELLNALGILGLFLGFNAVVIVILAVLGWI